MGSAGETEKRTKAKEWIGWTTVWISACIDGKCPSYAIGSFLSNECPEGSQRIEQQEACEVAASELGYTFIEKQDFDWAPKGCRLFGSIVHLNIHDSGRGEEDRTLICTVGLAAADSVIKLPVKRPFFAGSKTGGLKKCMF